MRAMARWLMAVIGLLALLSIARVAAAAPGKAEAPKTEAPQAGSATPGIADEVAAIREVMNGADRGEAVSDAAHGQADAVGRDGTRHEEGKEEAQPPADGGVKP